MNLDYSGERFMPGHGGPAIHLEHLHRYYMAATMVKGTVLDIGCGVGYGSALLARSAGHVAGVDIAPESLLFANENFRALNIHYQAGDARALAFRNATFDWVVCFELIEHLTEGETVLSEIARVLRPDGRMLLSTPNRPVYTEASGIVNPFHCREFDADELRALLSVHFEDVVLFGQRLVAGSLTWKLDEPRQSTPLEKFRLNAELGAGLAYDEEPTYMLALCGRRKESIDARVAYESLTAGRIETFVEEEAGRGKESEARVRANYETVLIDLSARLREADARIRELGATLESNQKTSEECASRLIEERDRRDAELHAIHVSRMWRVWMAWHRVRRVLMFPFRFPIRVARAVRTRSRRLLAMPLRIFTVPAGWIYLVVWTASTWIRARGRAQTRLPRATSPSAVPPRRPRILMLCPYPVYPADHGGGVRIYNLIRRLSRHCDLYLLIFIRADDDPEQRRALEPYVKKLYFHRWHPGLQQDLWGLEPKSAQLFAVPEVRSLVNEVLSRERIDILQLEYTELGQYGLPKFARVKVVLSEIDVTFRSRARRRSAGMHRRYPANRAFGHTMTDLMRLFRYEVRVARRADQVHVMSESDGSFLSRFLPDGGRSIRVVPNAVDLDRYTPLPEEERSSRQLLFVGNFEHLPNQDALDYLMADIWPRVRQRMPDAELLVVGARAGPMVFRHAGRDGVTVAGEVPDPVPYYQRCAALIAPIRAGSGTRLKILEALACGTPVVTTTIGAEGIEGTANEHYLLKDTAPEFADAVCSLLADGALRTRLARDGRELVERHYGWDQSADSALAGYAELMDGLTDERENSQAGASPGDVDISVIIPTINGGAVLEKSLTAIRHQRTQRTVEIICVDSESSDADRMMMERHGARVIGIKRSDFNHGLTRDLGASHGRGTVLVFINQDAVPCDEDWLGNLTEPLFHDDSCAAVQGSLHEVPELDSRFYWDSCGHRFYFTRESKRWIERYFGIGFSTVNAAIRRDVWQRHPFGYAQIMEDKKWQREVVAAGYGITVASQAVVYHTHQYRMKSLLRRCESEGLGWRTVGETYSFVDMLADLAQPRVYADLLRGLVRGRIRSAAELFFPWLRPLMVFRGNRWSRNVKL